MLRKTLEIFLWKHYKYHRFNWRVKLVNIALPIFMGITLLVILNETFKGRLKKCEHVSAHGYIIFVGYLHSLTCINVVLLPIVREKMSGIKEFLRISCRHSYWNLVTFYVLQVLVSFFIFGAVFATSWFMSMSKHYDMKYMVLLVALYVCSNVAFWFAISVCFNTGNTFPSFIKFFLVKQYVC